LLICTLSGPCVLDDTSGIASARRTTDSAEISGA
jgi:hypothetical protein